VREVLVSRDEYLEDLHVVLYSLAYQTHTTITRFDEMKLAPIH
jgi:hypothetical protein